MLTAEEPSRRFACPTEGDGLLMSQQLGVYNFSRRPVVGITGLYINGVNPPIVVIRWT
ncbi:hypothetical protein GCM10009608_46030 [Pseudonocardia alaniniphila]